MAKIKQVDNLVLARKALKAAVMRTPRIKPRIDNLVRARKALEPLWQEADSRGRCWGPKGRSDSPYRGSNIVLAKDNEVVILSLNKDGKVVLHSFRHSDLLPNTHRTHFSFRVHMALEKKEIPFVHGRQKFVQLVLNRQGPEVESQPKGE